MRQKKTSKKSESIRLYNNKKKRNFSSIFAQTNNMNIIVFLFVWKYLTMGEIRFHSVHRDLRSFVIVDYF